MPENRVSADITEADRQAVLAAIETIRQKLPFLIDLTPEERRALPKMGDKSRAFVSQALAVARQDSSYLPRSFSVEEMERDVKLAEELLPILTSLTQLQEKLRDTYTEVGSEAYTSALVVYQYARQSGGGAALDDLVDELGRRFARKTKREDPPPTGGGK